MKNILRGGPVFIIIAALLWSFDGLLRRGLFTLPPAVIVFWEHVLGAAILLPFVAKTLTSEVKKLTRKEWIAILVVSLFSGALGTILYTAALGKVQFIQFSVVVLLQQLQPIWAILTARIVLKEKVHKDFLGWAALAIVASYFVTFRDLKLNITEGSGTLVAAAFALLAGMMWAASTSFSKVALKKVSFQTATFLRFTFAPIFALIFILILNQSSAITSVNPVQWKSLIIITLSTGMVALLIYYYGLRRVEAKVSAICELVWPASAIFIGYFYFKETLSVTQIIGVLVLLYSIYRVSTLKKERH